METSSNNLQNRFTPIDDNKSSEVEIPAEANMSSAEESDDQMELIQSNESRKRKSEDGDRLQSKESQKRINRKSNQDKNIAKKNHSKTKTL